MNKRPGHVHVTTEVAYCPFCNRTRTLRREEHQLGNLVRTIVTCESCHRTLSSAMGVAAAATEPAAAPAAQEAPAQEAPAKEELVKTTPKPRRAPTKRLTGAKKAATPKPRSTAKATRKR